MQRDLGEIIDAAVKQTIPGLMVTVMEVAVTPDLGLAKVYLSLFNSKDSEADMASLNQQIPKIRHFLAGKLKDQVRKIPELMFYLDSSLDQAENIENLLRKIRKPES